MRVGTAAHPHRVQDEQLHDQRAIPGPMNEDLYDADSKAEVICPHCGEMVMILLDPAEVDDRSTSRTAKCAADPGKSRSITTA